MNVKTEPDDVSLILRAFKFAASKHRNQRRKDKLASPYINHLIAVAETLWVVGGIREAATVAAGILHDVIEDTDTSPEELAREFGPNIASIVSQLTDDKALPKHERKRLQIEHAAGLSKSAQVVKIADKISNLDDIIHSPPAGWSPERQKEYLVWANNVIAEVRGSNPALEQVFDRLFAEAMQAIESKIQGLD